MSKSSIPNVSDDAAVIRECATLDRLQVELNRLQAEHESATSGGPPLRSAFDRAVDEALGLESPASVPDADKEKAAQRVRVLYAALERQRRIVHEAESKASQRFAEAAKPDYVAIVKRGVRAISDLRKFILDERAFRDELKSAGVAFAGTIRPTNLPQGQFNEDDASRWLAEVKEHYGLAV